MCVCLLRRLVPMFELWKFCEFFSIVEVVVEECLGAWCGVLLFVEFDDLWFVLRCMLDVCCCAVRLEISGCGCERVLSIE